MISVWKKYTFGDLHFSKICLGNCIGVSGHFVGLSSEISKKRKKTKKNSKIGKTVNCKTLWNIKLLTYSKKQLSSLNQHPKISVNNLRQRFLFLSICDYLGTLKSPRSINPFQTSFTFHIDASHLICTKMKCFVTMWNAALGWNGLNTCILEFFYNHRQDSGKRLF